MTQLISKVQYRDFETGEFVEVEACTYEETIALIKAFLWETQRRNIVIDLTNPSVTIQGPKGDYLKLGPTFNGKFGLHYLKSKKDLHHKTFVEITESYRYIQNYFKGILDTAEFHKVSIWPQNISEHFITKDFKYLVNAHSVKRFLLETSLLNILISPVLFLILFYDHPLNENDVVFTLCFAFLLGGGVNSVGFLNYYLHSKNRILIMSRGNDLFYYGDVGAPFPYYKKDIEKVTVRSLKNSRHPLSEFAVVKVT